MTDLPTTYLSSDGKRETPLAEMAWTHLNNAIRVRVERGVPETDPMMQALRRERDSRPEPDPAAPPVRQPGVPAPKDDNLAPDVDPLAERLKETHKPLLSGAADLELEASDLPSADEIDSDDKIAKVDAWIVKAKRLAGNAEKERKGEKDFFLNAGRTVDRFFNGIGEQLTKRIALVEARKLPYLKAKRAREEARAAAEAERQRLEALRLEQEAAELRRQQAEQERQRAEAEAALQQAERDRAEAEARAEAAGADEDEIDLEPVDPSIEQAVDDAEAFLRRSEGAIAQTGALASKVETAATAAHDLADKSEQIAEGRGAHTLAKVSSGGATSSLDKVWKARVESWDALRASLGNISPFLPSDQIEDALKRAARAAVRPEIPGVVFYQDDVVKTRAARP